MARATTAQAEDRLLYYWGEGGHYGPFEIQQEGEWAGWPDFGQVMRYFRKRKAKLSSRAFGVLYGKEVNADGSAIAEGWIREMETQNKVPVDITKRKTIARLLKIPPMLFGLAVLEQIKLEPQRPPAVATGQTRLVSVAVDTAKYQNNVRTFWQLHETGNALNALGQLETDIGDLESLAQQAQGDLLYHVQEILFGYQILATHIVRDQRHFSRAYHHSNEAVRVAKSMNDADLIAAALFTRGRTRMEWGTFGTIEQGVFQVQLDKISAAIRDFQAALNIFPAQDSKDDMHPQLSGKLKICLNHARAILALNRGERLPASTLVALDDEADTVNQQAIHDPYTRVLITGAQKSWHQAGYLSSRASVFTTAGLAGHALKELNALERLTEGTYRRDDTRQFAWLDILKANIYMGLKEFGTATDHARRALLSCQDINSVTNIAIITDIYGRLLASPYKASGDVRELGEILRETRQMPHPQLE
jgi:tetratricopeptide (TPR) repeat protein